ncbi:MULTISPECIES: hypothetical protein [Cytobacillus]|uniref:hypothetical protein n=1 Tax=Cytobacillus TaxID=2675230 RepID=UPI00203F2228|nr:hypothetical protein [Cytobacillus firmus]MCM3707042.1 hypothetical protein [Cytobacillus firmus]
MSGIIITGFLLVILIGISGSKPSKSTYDSGNSSSHYFIGDYSSSSDNCSSFGEDGGGCGGGGD